MVRKQELRCRVSDAGTSRSPRPAGTDRGVNGSNGVAVVGVLYTITIPSLALLVVLIPVVGLGLDNAVIVLSVTGVEVPKRPT